MSSDTPRTNAEAFHCGPSPDEGFEAVPADACRKLERELAAVTTERDQLILEVKGLRRRIAELECIILDVCPHEWEKHDDSFDHEFGTEIVVYDLCEKCGSTRKHEPQGEVDPT